MTIRSKKQAEAPAIAFDFTDYLERVGFPHPEFTSLVEAGLTIYRADIRGAVVFLTVGGGVAGSNYQLSVRCDTAIGGTITQTQTVYVSREVISEIISPSSGVFLINSAGELLTTASGVVLESV